MSEKTETVTDSEARVALELMHHISVQERPAEQDRRTRDYWLTLYHQCRLAANGTRSLDSVLRRQ